MQKPTFPAIYFDNRRGSPCCAIGVSTRTQEGAYRDRKFWGDLAISRPIHWGDLRDFPGLRSSMRRRELLSLNVAGAPSNPTEFGAPVRVNE
jgi:hypothetical protein